MFKAVNGGIRGVTEKMPPCPVTAHFDGVLTISKFSGMLRYRWERSTGQFEPIQDLRIPAAAMTGPVDVSVRPDEWSITERGQQLTVSDRIHVLAPVNKVSPAVDLEAKCY